MLDQIQKRTATPLTRYPTGSELWQVEVLDRRHYVRRLVHIIYDRRQDLIMTVLPDVTSTEFNDFCRRASVQYGFDPKDIKMQRKTQAELDAESIQAAEYDRAHEIVERNRKRYATWLNQRQRRI